MSDFEIGALYWPSEAEANLEILETGASQLARGSKDTVTAFLSACGVKGEVAEWSIRPARSYFFCGFPDADQWEDRWRKGWTMTVKFATSSPQPDVAVFAPGKPLDVRDPTWVYENRIADASRERFTLIARQGEFGKAGRSIRAEEIFGKTNDQLEHFKIATSFISKGDLFLKLVFPSFGGRQEERIVSFIAELRRRGYLTHWHDLL